MMKHRYVSYTQSGHIFIRPGDDLDGIVDAMLATDYDEEFCLALDFDPIFLADLMRAGFLVMSAPMYENESEDSPRFLLLPKLHLIRSVLFWDDFHVTKSTRRILSRYELRFNQDFDHILERCARVHGEDWLTAPLREGLRQIRGIEHSPVQPVSFGVYRDGQLRAGEFGVICGGVYTSYSGYHDENSSGSAQLALTGWYLRDRGFSFWDLGMPLEYKDKMGAKNIYPEQFVDLFRGALVTNAKPW
jgi:Leu/Phe-tRNA-protein transferase